MRGALASGWLLSMMALPQTRIGIGAASETGARGFAGLHAAGVSDEVREGGDNPGDGANPAAQYYGGYYHRRYDHRFYRPYYRPYYYGPHFYHPYDHRHYYRPY